MLVELNICESSSAGCSVVYSCILESPGRQSDSYVLCEYHLIVWIWSVDL